MNIEQIINQKLTSAIACDTLEVLNESHAHNVAKGSETHFKVTLVSPEFKEMLAVKRHQKIYGILQDELQQGVHALALHLYSPQEWADKNGVSPQSPQCMGGSKK